MSCWYRLNQKPGLLTVASAPPPISCCLWTPSLSPLMHRNSSSPGSAPQTTCSPKLCPSFWPKPTSFLPFLFFKRKKKNLRFHCPHFGNTVSLQLLSVLPSVLSSVHSKMPHTGKKTITWLRSPSCLAITCHGTRKRLQLQTCMCTPSDFYATYAKCEDSHP